ncbi:MAG: helix-turn-helix transcriptional regulator [Candidatus Izemoplasmatales bacterium]|jgi:transcriptional regulator with XRE-family HTH domain|nr:helix-turn-helix transcriptional regulator [Candidatus Izemoplasmatales bacterium]
MLEKLSNELKRRRENACQFYYKGVGQSIRKKRLEMNLTQERVALGICSNTYLSKIENNQIVVNREHLYLLMERVGMDMDKISFPEEMIDYLEQSIKLFFYRDIEGYNELFKEVSKYEFAVLLQIIKLGYYVLIEDFDNAGLIYNEVFRYLTSLEEFGFSIFLIYSSFYNIGIANYKNARIILDKVENHFQNDDMVYGLYNFSKFLIYGNLHLNMTSSEASQIAISIFNKYSNIVRLNQLYLWREIFTVYEGNYDFGYFNPNILEFVTDKERNLYLIVLSSQSKDPINYLEYLKEEGDNYLLGLFIKARYYLLSDKLEEYKKVYDEISNLHYHKRSKLDYLYLLKLIKNNDEIHLKEYLINYALDLATQKQNLYFMTIITHSISNILANKKRYKDALTYRLKLDEKILGFQLATQVTIK